MAEKRYTLVEAHKTGLIPTKFIMDCVGKGYPTVITWLKGRNEPRWQDGVKIQTGVKDQYGIDIIGWK